jgi:hypothetical protein
MNLSDQTLALLRTSATGVSNRASLSDIAIDEYVPLRFRTYREPLGVGYIRLGNYSTTLVELALEPRTQVVRGVTVTSIDELAPWPELEVLDRVEGLPAVSTSFEGGERVDLRDEFHVAVRSGEVIVFWAGLTRCNGYQFGDACFLTVNGVLAGVWFTGLTNGDVRLFESHAGGA